MIRTAVLYTDELAQAMCERIAGGEPIYKMCRRKGMPSYTTFKRWQRENADFRAMVIEAKEDQADMFVDEINIVATNLTKKAQTPEQIAAARVLIDTRKWTAARFKPKVYGDRTTNELTGPGGESLSIAVSFVKAPGAE